MKNVFDYEGKTTLQNKFVLVVEALEGSHGVIHVFKSQTLELDNRGWNILFKTNQEISWKGAQERQDLSPEQRLVEPYDRGSPMTYVATNLSFMDVFTTKNGSRFLSQKRWTEVGSSSGLLFSTYDNHLKLGYVLDTMSQLEGALERVLPQMGVPVDDIEEIVEDILTKLAFADDAW